MKNKKGFTLVELLAVIVILGVLLLIAVPSVTKIINNTRKSAFESQVKLALENVSTMLSIAPDTQKPAAGNSCVIAINEISLDRGTWDGYTGYITVTNSSGNFSVTADVSTDKFSVSGKKLEEVVTDATFGSKTTPTSTCTFHQ